ncbi:MAG: M15 family metallopeptidase [Saprospiraceae bacterium]
MKQIIIFLFTITLLSCGAASSSDTNKENTITEKVNESDSTLLEQEVEKQPLVEENNPQEIVKTDKKESTEKPKKGTKRKAEKRSASQPVRLPTKTDDFSVDYLMGKFNPNTHPDFTTIKSKHASKGGMKLRKDTYEAFGKMYDAALKDGVRLKIISATRPFTHQKSIWEAKWNGKRKVNGQFLPANPRDPEERARLILMYSSMPGTSRHHWGTDIDLNDLNNPYFEKGTGKKIYDWLVENASEYGFCQVYSPQDDSRPYGYLEEKWHWSYVPVARRLTNLYAEKLTDSDISGFEGSETALSIGMIEKYVLGINPICK